LRSSPRQLSHLEQMEILRLYELGLSSDEIKLRFQCGRSLVLDIVRRLGGNVRSPGAHARKLADEQELQLIEMYELGVPVDEIADKFNITRWSVDKIRQRRDVPARAPVTGPANLKWKGGTRMAVGGYIDERILSNDPFFCMARAASSEGAGYVFQHRLVMARHLGRPLLSHETVHHKNGIRSDNRIENLELWSSKHPRGARVADQVAWAKEILAQYGDFQT
jgi:DNA-binding CsgD family transcriptional regulator